MQKKSNLGIELDIKNMTMEELKEAYKEARELCNILNWHIQQRNKAKAQYSSCQTKPR